MGAAEMWLSVQTSKCTDEKQINLAHGAEATSGKHVLSILPHLRLMYSMPFTQVLHFWTGHVLRTELSASSGAGRNVCIPAFDVQHAFHSGVPTLDLMGAAD